MVSSSVGTVALGLFPSTGWACWASTYEKRRVGLEKQPVFLGRGMEMWFDEQNGHLDRCPFGCGFMRMSSRRVT